MIDVLKAAKFSACVLALAAVAPLAVSAESANNSTSCLGGSVQGYDYSELSQNLSDWNQRTGVTLNALSGQPVLRVVDANNNSVCIDEANSTATCRFTSDPFNSFTIIVDNMKSSDRSVFRLCAF